MSLSDVRKPHIKKSAVAMVMARTSVFELTLPRPRRAHIGCHCHQCFPLSTANPDSKSKPTSRGRDNRTVVTLRDQPRQSPGRAVASTQRKLEGTMTKPQSLRSTPIRTSSPPTQLLIRNLARLGASSPLVAGLYDDDAVAQLSPAMPNGTFVALDYAAFTRAQTAATSTQTTLFTAFYAPDEPVHDLAVVFLQKGKEFNQLLLTMVAQAVLPGGRVLLVGENSAGIRSSRRMLEALVGPIVFSDAARHSVLYLAEKATVAEPAALASWFRHDPIEIAGETMTLATLPGVFSYGRLDKGTQLLLESLPPELADDVLDLGCGSGVIGAQIKRKHPETRVTLTDSSALALAATAETFRENALEAESILPSNVFSEIAGRFDVIVSNPPFHEGVRTQYETSATLIREAAAHLRPKGTLILVANHFLHYETVLEEHVGPVVCLARDAGYKVLLSRKA